MLFRLFPYYNFIDFHEKWIFIRFRLKLKSIVISFWKILILFSIHVVYVLRSNFTTFLWFFVLFCFDPRQHEWITIKIILFSWFPIAGTDQYCSMIWASDAWEENRVFLSYSRNDTLFSFGCAISSGRKLTSDLKKMGTFFVRLFFV